MTYGVQYRDARGALRVQVAMSRQHAGQLLDRARRLDVDSPALVHYDASEYRWELVQ